MLHTRPTTCIKSKKQIDFHDITKICGKKVEETFK